jgi:transposase-like protein
MAEANPTETPDTEVPTPTDSKGRKLVPRREFSAEFKREAVARAKKYKGPTADLAREMKIHPTVLRRWLAGNDVKTIAKATKVKGVNITAKGMKVYSIDFKRAAVTRWNKGKETGIAIAKSLGIHSSMLSAWRRKFSPESAKSSPKHKSPKHTLSPKTPVTVSKFSLEFKQGILARIAKGERATDIGKEIGVTPSGIDYWRKTIGGKISRKYKKHGLPVPNALGVPFDINGAKMSPAMSIGQRDAISFLKHAKDAAHQMLQHGLIKEFDQAHLLAMMALNSLTK